MITRREYPKVVIQEMIVNACCHRAYNIKGTEIQIKIKMFDNRLVIESPGRLPSLVKLSNIRHTHFSRNPKIASFLKTYQYVKEYGEGVDRVYRELEINGSDSPLFHTDDFILKVTFFKSTSQPLEKVTELFQDKKLSENRKKIIRLIKENPYISKTNLSKEIGISYTSINRNIEAMRGQYLRRVGSDKGGFWEIIYQEKE